MVNDKKPFYVLSKLIVIQLNLKCTLLIIVIRYKVYNEQQPRARQNTQHVLYRQQARAGWTQ